MSMGCACSSSLSKLTLHSERYQPSSSLQNPSMNHNFFRNLHKPSFLVQPQQTYRKLHPSGYKFGSNNIKLQVCGQKATHRRFCQSTGNMVVIVSSTLMSPDGEMGPSRTFQVYKLRVTCDYMHLHVLKV